MTLLLLFAAISIGFSFLCSILEAALLSITPSYIRSLHAENPVLSERLRKLKDKIDDPLSAILTLNTIAHTAGATGVGAQVAVLFGEAWLGVASAVMTLLILILSEIIPKTIGAVYWRSLAPYLPSTLGVMMWVFAPFLWLSQFITRRIGANEHENDVRAEISALAAIGRDQHVIDEEERKIIVNTLYLHEIKAKDIMTPRTVSRVAHPDMPVNEFFDWSKSLPFSRFPLIGEDGLCVGYIHKGDLSSVDGQRALREVCHDALTVKDETNIDYLLGEMLRGRQHICVVYDSLGTWLGIVTLEDILETVLGQEIIDESDSVSDLRRYAKQRWSRKLKGTS
ncbi:CNNM domain-containing protein [Salinibius halmophilus]|uniref:CNNM domain-containing protein n=1 Tax=Salinibius halmophilus TaxID=1853216 RepID=UPI000E66EE90|nr:CNNM domain-containing protein [Salinibius halmophilus]